MSNILVIAEHANGELKKATLTCIGFAREAARRTGGQVHGLVLGHGSGAVAEAMAAYVAVVHHADHADLAHPLAEISAKAIAAAVPAAGATVVAMAATAQGKDILPRAAALLDAGLASDILGFASADGFAVTRPIQAGNIIATCEVTSDLKLFSPRPTEFEPATPSDAAGSVAALSVELGGSKTRFVKFEAVASDRPQLSDAKVVIAGGRGLKEPKGFPELIEPLADKLGAGIGASRAVVDAGWVPNDMQIGQTGKVVAPDLYFAVGISGAIQHVAGMKGSKTIVAINKNPDAPIFQIADYGLVADLFKVVPELTEKL